MSQRSPIRPRPGLPKVVRPDGTVDGPALARALDAVHSRTTELEGRHNEGLSLSGSVDSRVSTLSGSVAGAVSSLSGTVASSVAAVAASVVALSGTLDAQRVADGLDSLRSYDWRDDYVSDRASNFSAGGGTCTLIAGSPGHPGIVRMGVSTSGTTNAFTYPMRDFVSIVPGGGGRQYFTAVVRVPTVSNGTDNIGARSGYMPLLVTPILSDGVYFEYDRSRYGSDNAWRFVTAATGSRSVLNTGVAPVAGGWHVLQIEFAEQGDAVTGSIVQGSTTTSVATRTYVPNASPSNAYYACHIALKTLGNGNLNYDVDLTRLHGSFTGSRGN